MKWKNWTVAIIGAWFIISPWVFGFSNHAGAVWTSVIAGAIQLIVAIWAAALPESTADWSNWQNWTSLIMGIWFIIQPWSVGISSMTGNTWNDVILGAITVLLDLWIMGENGNASNSGGNARRAA
ncbi:SPW repeat protein [Alicyclobacillus sp. SO9]|uniref:SPW repeat protein n=1 Tax=Alicyclobacillus sp. SO9 TaxID=2665646 RepID=UPI0018E8E122|nr:SPW repeat protein [Alicyclobacillus sp. SO9]QQE78995.1 SPW repeat protein [Alicyclobacillus sp. SO9]